MLKRKDKEVEVDICPECFEREIKLEVAGGRAFTRAPGEPVRRWHPIGEVVDEG
jgi:hypothetical protein